MKKILFSGCSYVAGIGLEGGKTDNDLFCNILVNNNTTLSGNNVVNVAIGGISNEQIFQNSAKELMTNNYDYAFVCWTSNPRYTFYSRLAETDDLITITPNSKLPDKFRNVEKFRNDLLLLEHQHYHLYKVFLYVNILLNLAKNKNTKIFFINSLLHIPDNFFEMLQTSTYNDFFRNYIGYDVSTYLYEDLVQKIKQDFISVGGPQLCRWLNLYQPLLSLQMDKGTDNQHPGTKSHKLFAELLNERLDKIDRL